ncbi:MAG TPA: aminodeoxychorismate lyase, partial [Magnetospirillaceae bacterium]|nr:aminodeoxychorismate lyase [Magnetospirillaceae bacterium]
MKWLIRLAATLVFLGVAAMAGRLAFQSYLQAPGPAPEPIVVVLAKGTGISEIGQQLAKSGVIAQPLLWPAMVKLSGRQALKAGEYEFP